MTQSVQRQAARGVAWMLAFKLVDRSLGLLSTLILVRLLSPADFGIVAIAMAFVAMAELLAGFGFDIALIQNQQATEEHFHTAWTCNVVLGLTIAAIMAVAAAPIASFYARDELFAVVCALAAGPAISGLENIGIVAFRKELNFQREFLFLFLRRVIAFAVTMSLAFLMHDYTALVAGVLVSRAAGTTLSYFMHPFRPRFTLAKIRDLFHFSKWIVLNNLIIFARERSTDFAVGRRFGPASLGLFNVANEFSNLPLTELSAPANRALLPAFARLQDDPETARSTFVNTVGLLALAAIPMSFGIAAIAPSLVPVILGPRWVDSIPLMEILAFSGGVIAFQSPVCAILIACGRPDLVFRCHAVFVAVLLATVLGAPVSFGVPAAAAGMLAAAVVSTPFFFWYLRRQTDVSLRSVLARIIRPLTAGALMWLAVRWLVAPPPAGLSTLQVLPVLVAQIALGAVTYTAVLGALWFAVGRPDGAERIMLDLVRARLSRRKAVAG